jgi:ssDNA-binding Zn-finger/Zn-ribbon topoisomerase 1
MGCGCNKKVRAKGMGGYRAARSDKPLSNSRGKSRLIRSSRRKGPKTCPKCGSLLKSIIKRKNRKDIRLLQCVNNVCTYARKV